MESSANLGSDFHSGVSGEKPLNAPPGQNKKPRARKKKVTKKRQRAIVHFYEGPLVILNLQCPGCNGYLSKIVDKCPYCGCTLRPADNVDQLIHMIKELENRLVEAYKNLEDAYDLMLMTGNTMA
jgi:hypothetical protein